MSVEQIVTLIVNNGACVACLIYFMWFNNNTLKQFSNEMKEMNKTLAQLMERLEFFEKSVKNIDNE